MENLYTFSKNSWHVKFFIFIYGADPTQEFKTMCPYFWTYVFTILFLPLVLLIKLFGGAGTKFLEYCRTYSEKREDKIVKKLAIRASIAVMSAEAAYNLYQTKCYQKFSFQLDWQLRAKIGELRWEYIYNVLGKQRHEQSLKKQELKESQVYKSISVGIALAIGVVAVKLLFMLASYAYDAVDWIVFGQVVLSLIGVFVGLFALITFCQRILFPWISSITCNVKCPVGAFSSVGKVFVIGFSMIYATYKKYCPMITWKE